MQIILLLLLSSLVYSQDLKELLGSLNNVTPKVEVCEENNDMEQCAVDMCGPPETRAALTLSNNNFKDQVLKDVEKNKKQYLQKTKDDIKKYLTQYEDSRKQLLDLAKTKSIKPNTRFWNQQTWNKFATIAFDSYLTAKIDLTKPLNERHVLTIAPEIPKQMLDGIKEYALQKQKELAADELTGFANGLYSEQEKKEIITKSWTKLKVYLETKPDVMGQEDTDSWKQLIADDFAKLDSLDTAHLSVLHNMIFNTLEQYESNFDPYTKKCESKACHDAVLFFLTQKKLPELIEKLPSAELTDEALNDAAIKCLSTNILNQEKIRISSEFQKQIPSLTEKFIKHAMKRASKHSRDAFRTYMVENTKITFNSFAAGKGAPAILERVKNNQDPAHLLVENKNAAAFETMPSCVPFDDRDRVEGMETNESSVILSYHTCTFNTSGKTIFAHELGHVLSGAFSKNILSESSKADFLKLRACVSDRHLQKESRAFAQKFVGDIRKTEEDTADVMASLAMGKEMNFCGLLYQEKDRKYKLSNIETDDTHSQSIMRVIWSSMALGRTLPKSCQSFLEKNSDKYKTNICN